MRRGGAILFCGVVAGCQVGSQSKPKPVPTVSYVTVQGRQFVLDHHAWYLCGTNLWYGAFLGRPSNPEGRDRLVRELDRLQQLGINNLRVLGAAEACTTANATKPVITLRPGDYNEDMLQGLDFLISEAGKRQMKLVVFLNNYWDWSGGIPQYLAWATGRPVQGLGDLPWKEWNRVQSAFYTNQTAMNLYRNYLAMIVNRTNTITQIKYRDDPAIMSWELANEPRAGEREGENEAVFAAFRNWVESTASLIHGLDPHHLVTTGSEGTMGCLGSEDYFRQEHGVKAIDYAVFHLWPNNWGWYKRANFRETIGETLTKSRQYIQQHLAMAESLDKPIVIEEFGLDRDGGFTTDIPTTARDQFYQEVFSLIESSVATGGSAAGSSFWLWGGAGRPPHAGDPSPADGIGAGDMLQEAPGLNAVFDCDQSTLAIISTHFANLRRMSQTRVVRNLAADVR